MNSFLEQCDGPPDDGASGPSFERPESGFMSAQIAMMRAENPDVWQRIDELCDGPFYAADFRQFFSHGGGACSQCGYDLTGNMSGRCPECGTPIVVSAHARRTVSILIMEALRRRDPTRWEAVSTRLERERLETIKRENAQEGARRDGIRQKALKNWLDRKREQGDG